MRLTPRCPVGNALNDLFCVPKQMGAEIPSAEQISGYRTSSLEQCQLQNVTAERRSLAPAD
jgi:hypothetical protein